MNVYYINTERISCENLAFFEDHAEAYRKEKIERARALVQRNEQIGVDILIKIAAINDLAIYPSDVKSGYNENGAPFVYRTDKNISIAHSSGCAVLAVSSGAVGVDVELLRLTDMSSFSRRYFTEGENKLFGDATDKLREFFRIWTGKEAYFKYSNEKFSSPLSVDTSKESSAFVFECDGRLISAVGEEKCEFLEITDRDVKTLSLLIS